MQTSNHGFENWEKKVDPSNPKGFNFKPKQFYIFYISFPGFHCRLCSAHLLLLCRGNMQSKEVVMSLMVSFCFSFMLLFLCSSLLFSVPASMRVTYGPSGLSLFYCGWPWCEWLHSLRGVFAVVLPGGLLLAWNLYCPEQIYSHTFPLQSPSVSLSNCVFLCLLSLLADSLCAPAGILCASETSREFGVGV